MERLAEQPEEREGVPLVQVRRDRDGVDEVEMPTRRSRLAGRVDRMNAELGAAEVDAFADDVAAKTRSAGRARRGSGSPPVPAAEVEPPPDVVELPAAARSPRCRAMTFNARSR